MFTPLPDKPDHDALELDDPRALGARADVRARCASRTRAGPRFSFVDGPVTANRMALARPYGLGPHAEGRLPALQGVARATTSATRTASTARASGSRSGSSASSGSTRSARSRSTGSPSSRAAAATSSCGRRSELTEGSIRLGQWMDWGKDYFTFSRHEHRVHLALPPASCTSAAGSTSGHRSTEWCPRCGTSISAARAAHGHLRGPDRPVALRALPAARPAGRGARRSGRRRRGRCRRTSPRRSSPTPSTAGARTATGSRSRAIRTRRSSSGVPGARARRAGATAGPFDDARPGRRGRAPRDPLGRGRPRGRARASSTSRRAAAREDFELVAACTTCPCSRPSTRRAASTTRTAGCTGSRRSRPPIRSSATSRSAASSSRRGRYEHRYPHCWRCHTPLIFRISDDWFIAVDDLRQPLLDANATVEWTPAYMGKRMDDWLRNMGDWNISRRRYYGLPLPFYPCECGHLNVIGSQAELDERATSAGSTSSRSSAGPGSTRCRSAARRAATSVRADPGGRRRLARRRHRPVLDARLGEPRVRAARATRPAPRKGLTTADLPDHAYWEQWFPADWVSEMREQIRLWFYSQLFMSVALDGPGAVPARCSATRRCSTSTAARCTARGGTRSTPRTRSRAWART